MPSIPFLNPFLSSSSKRFYAFRDLERLRALKRVRRLFNVLWLLALFGLATGGGAFAVWLVMTGISIVEASDLNTTLEIAKAALTTGLGILFICMVVRSLIERRLTAAESRDHKKNPKGAKKYRAVMRVNKRVARVNFCLTIIILGACVAGIALGVTNTYAIAGFLIGIILLTIFSKLYASDQYKKVRAEIAEIKLERKSQVKG